MANKTNIAWCDSTINWWTGCTKVSDGCKHCYAETLSNRFDTFGKWGAGKPRVKSKSAVRDAMAYNRKPWICDECGHAHHLYLPTHENKIRCGGCGSTTTHFHRRRIFSLSLGDIMDVEAEWQWKAEAFDTIRKCSDVDWILCSKRWENWRKLFEKFELEYRGADTLAGCAFYSWVKDWLDGKPPSNIILLASVENQAMADLRIPQLLDIPARWRGLSLEPLLGAVELNGYDANGVMHNWLKHYDGMPDIHWLIVGGESGANARPCNVEWIRSLVVQGKAAGVPVFVKQLGANIWDAPVMPYRWEGIKDKKGGDITEWPDDLKVREWYNEAKWV